MILQENIIIDTDAYKLTHWKQHLSNLQKMYSYGEARTGSKYDWITFFGLQMVLKDHFVGQVITLEKIEEAERYASFWFGKDYNYFNKTAWVEILKRYDGKLPMKIKAVPEGKIVNKSNVLFTMESLDPLFAPLLNSMETLITHTWYPIVVATHGLHILKNIYPYYRDSNALDMLMYAINDFGFRGTSCFQEAYRGGAAQLLNGYGSDTTVGDRALDIYYHKNHPRLISVLASEHSVPTSFGPDKEVEYVLHLLDVTPDDAIISCVGDSYDIYNFARNVLGHEEVKSKIIARTGRFVLRPDSGNPIEVNLTLLPILAEVFGYIFHNGYKVINHNVGLIQGDGMNINSITELYKAVCNDGWSAANIVVGSGGGLLREHTRDDISFAIKASYAEYSDGPINIQKNPVTSSGKKSKTGQMKLVPGYTSNKLTNYMTVNHMDLAYDGYKDTLETVFDTGELVKDYTFEEILNNYSLDKFLKEMNNE